MDGVEPSRDDDSHLHWKAKIAGVTREWDAEIVRQDPNREVAWQATSGPPTAARSRSASSASTAPR